MKVPKKLLEVEGLKIYYRVGKKYVKAVDGVSFFIRERETLGLVGESGCGKSTLGFGIMKLLPPGALMKGRMIFQGKNLLELDDEEFRKLRGSKVSMIFQDPMTSLNPIMKIKDHFEDRDRSDPCPYPSCMKPCIPFPGVFSPIPRSPWFYPCWNSRKR